MTLKTTIVMRSMNDSPDLARKTMESLSLQEGVEFRLIHIDSGSTDGTLEEFKRFGGEIFHIRPLEYIPGAVLNFGLELAEDELVTFLNADAVPVGRRWLALLLDALANHSDAIAAFSRQLPREDALPVFRRDYDRAFPEDKKPLIKGHFFSMASSTVRRSWWKEHRFDETLRYSEDTEWTYRARLQGKQILYVPDSIVVHSHNYTPEQCYRRFKGEGEADAWIYRTKPSFLRQVALPLAAAIVRDARTAAASSDTQSLLNSPRLRYSQRIGYWDGLTHGLKTAGSLDRQQAPDLSRPSYGRFTVASEPELEEKLDRDMAHLVKELLKLHPKPQAIILGGGYGRREGGVWVRDGHRLPYNDYDLYAVYDSATPLLPKKLRHAVHRLGQELSKKFGVDVDICPVSEKKLRKAPPRMEWVELRRGSLVLFGPPRYLEVMPDYNGSEIPYDEGERLLMNRGVGLLLAKRSLKTEGNFDREMLDFVTRNIHKAVLAAGDVILLRMGLYHYSYRERLARFRSLEMTVPETFSDLKKEYARAMQFREAPKFPVQDRITLLEQWEQVKSLLQSSHLWFVQSTLGAATFREYAEHCLHDIPLHPKSLFNPIKNRSYMKNSEVPVSEWFLHPQKRVRAALPFLLFSLSEEFTEEDEAILHRALLIDKNNRIDPRTAEETLLNLWREVN